LKDELLLRLQYLVMRLEEHAHRPPAAGLTEPDQPSGEQWEWGQVWAHLAEFVPFWMGQIDIIRAGSADEAVPFGRTKADEGRIAAIERDRAVPVAQLWERLHSDLGRLWNFIDHFPDADWSRRGLHPTRGEMTMPDIFHEFLIGHLEEHADQLDGLANQP